ncbi:MAG: DUF5060 domain-containing protein, partial [Bacteroidota bacterium]
MKTIVQLCLVFIPFFVFGQTYSIEGELKKWHKVSIIFDGPSSSETASPNPFADYKLEVTFTNGSRSYVVQGYFAGDGNADETSANSGNKWIAHFSPDTVGTWNFTTTFELGTDVAIGGASTGTGILHNISGNFNIMASDKVGRDHRARGRLQYVGEQYLQFAEDSTWFYKVGADAPENTLAYEDFDATPNRGGRLKAWQPHAQDYDSVDASAYTWQGGKGSELLGVINYLATKKVNAFSFLTFSLSGDDENVFPHLLKVDIPTYNTYGDAQQWNDGVHHDRFDISKMAQWEKIFEYADKKGLYLHFKTQETENDGKMDGGDVDRERKLYYRELVARFGHHLALNWNTGEENTQTAQQEIDMAAYLSSIDPYHHNIVIHTYPGQHNRYTPLLGSLSEYTGTSLQTSNNNFQDLNGLVNTWNMNAANAGEEWIIAVDEPGNASIGTNVDPNDIDLVRHRVIWGILMGGGAGVEFYYGYQSGCGDLNCQDHRTRDTKYTHGSYAIHFFDNYLQSYLPNVFPDNGLTTDTDDYALTNGSNMVCVYRPNGGTTDITLDNTRSWFANWYNPRTGVMDSTNTQITTSLIAPDIEDWVAIIHSECPEVGTACDDGLATTENDTIDINCNCSGIPVITSSPLLEAESAAIGSQWTTVTDSAACNCSYMLPPAGQSAFPSAPSNPEDRLRFTLNLEQAGVYKIYARVWTTNDGDDSFWVRANNGTWQKWNKINFPYTLNGYQWARVGNWVSGDFATPVDFNLIAGTNTVDFAWRESGAKLDKIFITQEDLSVLNKVRKKDATGEYSFKYIVEEACPNDTITFDASLNGDTIMVSQDSLPIGKPITIKGNGTNATIIDGAGQNRIFTNHSDFLYLKDLKLINGFGLTDGGAFINYGFMLLENVVFE